MPNLKEEADLKKLYFLLLLAALCLSVTAIAEADFWPDNLAMMQKNTIPQTLPKINKFDTTLQDNPAQVEKKYDPWPKNPPQIGTLILEAGVLELHEGSGTEIPHFTIFNSGRVRH